MSKKYENGFQNPEIQKELGKRGAAASLEKQREEGSGFFDAENKSKGGKAAQPTLKKEEKGLYSEEVRKAGTKAAVKSKNFMNNQQKSCPYCGYTNNPGVVGRHMKKCSKMPKPDLSEEEIEVQELLKKQAEEALKELLS